MCNHETHLLVGTAAGIECKGCGKVFKDFAELEADRSPAEKPAAEKPKTRARKKKEAAE